VITSDPYGAEYTFSQVYDGVRVFGRNITVSANSSDVGDFIASSVVPTTRLANANLNFTFSKEQAETSAKLYHSGSFDVRSDNTEKVIFTLFSCDNAPVPAYLVNLYGVDDEGAYLDENVFVNALNGEVIYSSTNIHDLTLASGQNEAGENVLFPVMPSNTAGRNYNRMWDSSTNVEVFDYDCVSEYAVSRDEFGRWDDKQQVSAYTNMIDVIKWWKASFDRDSLDGHGGHVNLVTHERIAGYTDNAFWCSWLNVIAVCDPSASSLRSCGSAVDVMAHESTHAVFGYRAGDFPYESRINRNTGEGIATGAINEGYADIFGCLMTGQWKNGRDVISEGGYFRDMANPRIRHLSQAYTGSGDNGGVHSNSALVSYPFYLMNSRYGFSMLDLSVLWYKSMRMGYHAASSLRDVRVCVLRAARKIGMSDEQKDNIRSAFNDVGISEVNGNLHGLVIDREDNSPIQGASVILLREDGTGGADVSTGIDGKYSIDVAYGTYTVTISKNNYVELEARREIEEGDSIELNAALVVEGEGNISGTVRDALTGNTLSGVTVRLREGWSTEDQNAHTYTQQTTSNGFYSMTSVDAGYYTVEALSDDYAVSTAETTIAPNQNTVNNLLLSPMASGDVYRVTLEWGANPRDIDSHLIGPMPNGGTFHVYFSDKRAEYNGQYVAVLDHDDTRGNGFETITFKMQPGDTFKYYVHWYAGDGTWSGSNAVVNLYKGAEHLGSFNVPNVNQDGYTAGRYWRVFDITNGLEPVVRRFNNITSSQPSITSQNGLSTTILYYPQKVE
ncbi:MAG: carboxypeptidase regulatory-like domain-containing protein, partial [Synergistaceae bacterium]|nr:carboxypeptidase regulatory-like domain-containing protein [Synergistaceae bacterium]